MGEIKSFISEKCIIDLITCHLLLNLKAMNADNTFNVHCLTEVMNLCHILYTYHYSTTWLVGWLDIVKYPTQSIF